jgi:hypothetical protein
MEADFAAGRLSVGSSQERFGHCCG